MKRVLFCLVLAVSPLATHAGDTQILVKDEAVGSLGVAAGYVPTNAVTMRVAGVDRNTQFSNGYAFGMTTDWRLWPFVWVGAKLMYVRQGVKLKGAGSTLGNFLEIPFLVKFKIDVEKNLNAWLQAGPNTSFKLSGTGYKSVGVGVDLGGGLEYMFLPNQGLGLDFRYSLGLTNRSNTAGTTIRLWALHLLFCWNYYFQL